MFGVILKAARNTLDNLKRNRSILLVVLFTRKSEIDMLMWL